MTGLCVTATTNDVVVRQTEEVATDPDQSTHCPDSHASTKANGATTSHAAFVKVVTW